RLELGALFHDIGKIGIPSSILAKPGRLTGEERMVMQTHPELGERIIAPIERLEDVRPIVRHCHEHYDGSGYPDRKAGEPIPLEAYARLIVRIGLNVQQGQDVAINGLVEHAPLVRAVARAAYAAGARYVDAFYVDYHVKGAQVELGPEGLLDWTPPYLLARLEDLAERQGARVSITGDPDPDLLAHLDQRRVGAARMTRLEDLSLRQVVE